ncbi:F-box domain containing protein, partial [Tanacetum coccineum]
IIDDFHIVKGTRQRSNSNDFISQMSDDILVMIVSFAYKGGGSNQQSLHKMEVNSVIQSYSHPVVQDFRIRFCLTNHHKGVIDEWLQFAINKKVEFLELNLMNKPKALDDYVGYSGYPLRFFDTKLSTCPSLNATVVEILSLKKLVLKKVKVTETILQAILTNCPHLETLFIYYSSYLKNIHVYGRALKLKHFKIVGQFCVDIYLSDFDLVSFTYNGAVADLRLSHLPKLEEVDIYRVRWTLDNNVFDQISSCALSLQVLSIDIDDPTLDSIPELPSVKKLRLKMGGCKYNCLVYLASILNACQNLVTLTLEQDWTSPTINMTKAKDVTNPNEHLKIVEIVGYHSRIYAEKLVKYIIHTTVALKKIVIDPCWNRGWLSRSARNFLRDKEACSMPARISIASRCGLMHTLIRLQLCSEELI